MNPYREPAPGASVETKLEELRRRQASMRVELAELRAKLERGDSRWRPVLLVACDYFEKLIDEEDRKLDELERGNMRP